MSHFIHIFKNFLFALAYPAKLISERFTSENGKQQRE